VVAGLVPVEPPDVLRFHGPQVAPLVRKPPPPRRLHSSSDSDSHGSVHLNHRHHRPADDASIKQRSIRKPSYAPDLRRHGLGIRESLLIDLPDLHRAKTTR
jgi:hypothetical protein